MKVVINRCFGGFGLSEEALRALAATDCPHVKRLEPPEYYGPDWRERMKEDEERNSHLFWTLFIDGKVICDEHRSDAASRTCPHLIAIVEKLGAKASGSCARLDIVRIPKGVEFVVEEYDGSEHIAEEHRTWR